MTEWRLTITVLALLEILTDWQWWMWGLPAGEWQMTARQNVLIHPRLLIRHLLYSSLSVPNVATKKTLYVCVPSHHQDVLEGSNLRVPLQELHQMIMTPIKAFTGGEDTSLQRPTMNADSKSSAPGSHLAGGGGEAEASSSVIAEGDLPSQFTRVMGKGELLMRLFIEMIFNNNNNKKLMISNLDLSLHSATGFEVRWGQHQLLPTTHWQVSYTWGTIHVAMTKKVLTTRHKYPTRLDFSSVGFVHTLFSWITSSVNDGGVCLMSRTQHSWRTNNSLGNYDSLIHFQGKQMSCTCKV